MRAALWKAKFDGHLRVFTDLTQPWVQGYHRNIYARNLWKYVDVDMDEFQRRNGS